MRELNITMLGARYVGKTSFLTSMFYEYEQNIAKTRIQFTPDQRTTSILGNKLAELKSLNDNLKGGGIASTEAAAGPKSIRSFVFDLGQKGKKSSLRLHFWDYPGGYVIAENNQEEQEFVKQRLAKSVAVLIAIDTPALMEAKGKWHYTKNRPLDITAHFKRVYGDLNSPRLVILAPIKCETYLQNSTSANILLQRIKTEYASLLDFFSSEPLLDKVTVVVTPVQTVGTIFFSYIDVINGEPIPRFKKPNPDSQYQPQDNEQPLKYILRFLLKQHVENQWGVFNFVRDWFSLDEYLKEAVREFAKDCKTNNGFEVIQGKDWLNI